MDQTTKRNYEAGETPPVGTYLCVECEEKSVVRIKNEGEELPVCPRCNSNWWRTK